MAIVHPGQMFVVLESVAACRIESMIRTHFIDGSIVASR